MDLKKFNVDQYVRNNMLIGLYEDDERVQGLKKQVKNLLNYFFEDNPNYILNKKPNFFMKIKNKNIEGSKYERDKAKKNMWHLFNVFPLSNYLEEDVTKFLDLIFNLKYNVSSKVVSNINKINIDQYLYIFDNLNNNKKEYEYYKEITEKKERNRFIIRNGLLDELEILMKNLIYIKNILIEDENYNNLYIFADYVSDIILQCLIYWIVTIEGIEKYKKLEILNNINIKVLNFIDSIYESHIKYKIKVNSFTIEESIEIFSILFKSRNKFGEYIKVIDELEEEVNKEFDLFNNIKDEYIVKKYSIKPKDDVVVRNIITEGKNIDNYNQKFKECKEVIELFRIYGGRKISSSNLMDLKVHFRELFISDSKYKTQARTIIRKYLKDCQEKGKLSSFEKESEYIFIREKISRGYFREKGILDLYCKKNEIQRNIYELMLLTYLVYDYKYTLELLYQISLDLIEEMAKFLYQNF